MASDPTAPTAPPPAEEQDSSHTTTKEQSHVLPEEAALFGGLNAAIADDWVERLDVVCRERIDKLPLITPVRTKSLIDRFLPVFWRHIDVTEVYSSRNIFSLAMYQHQRRSRIVRACLEKMNNNSRLSSSSAQPLPDVTTSKHQQTNIPKDDVDDDTMTIIPTPEQLAELQTDVFAMRQRLQAAQHRRVLAQQAAALGASATKLSEHAVGIVGDTSVAAPAITVCANSATTLASSKAQGEDLVRQLAEIKHKRSDRDFDDDNVVQIMPPLKKRPALSLVEHYQELQNALGPAQQVRSVQQVFGK